MFLCRMKFQTHITVNQIRSKFKKLVSECKKVILTIKTATGIKRFLDDKGYGAWFDKLFAIIKTRDTASLSRLLNHQPLNWSQMKIRLQAVQT